MKRDASTWTAPAALLVLVDAADRRTVLVASTATLALFAARAWSGQPYPTKPIRLIIPFPPGQAADIFGRVLAQRLAMKWGWSVYVENRPGGLGVPALVAAKSAPPDGYTMLMGTSSTHSINPAVYSDLPYDPINDFIPVSNVVISPLVLVVHPSFAGHTLAEVLVAAKRETRGFLIASPGQGTSQHMAIELLASRAGVKLELVHYKGSGPALIDLIGGHVQLMVDSVASALPQIRARTIRPIAVATARRVPQLPDVPTIAESGYPGFESFGWAGVLLPRGTPQEIVGQLSAEIQLILRQPAVVAEIIARGSIPDPRSPEDFANFIRADTAKWKELARSAGLQMQR